MRDLGANRDAQAIVRSIISLGMGLGVTITAEGVETEAELSCLRAEGCHEGQGFLFSRARPNAEIVRLLQAQSGADPPRRQRCERATPLWSPDGYHYLSRALALVQIVGQRQRHAMAQFGARKRVLYVENDASVALETQFRRVQFTKVSTRSVWQWK